MTWNMIYNVGPMDRFIRSVVGLAFVAYAVKDGLPITGAHWAGLLGLVLLGTAFVSYCPLYQVFGISSATRKKLVE